MYKYICKLMFVTLTALGVAAPAFALEVKLLCSIKLVSTYPNGQVDRENFTDMIDVIDDNNEVSITPQSDKLGMVTTRKLSTTLTTDNFSDSNKWNIAWTGQSRKGVKYKASFTIDRNTGLLFYSQDWNEGRLMESATGSCEKVDATKRKF